jgi:hypothetical protein
MGGQEVNRGCHSWANHTALGGLYAGLVSLSPVAVSQV